MAANGCSRSFSGSKKSTSSDFGSPSASATPRSAATKPEERSLWTRKTALKQPGNTRISCTQRTPEEEALEAYLNDLP